MTHGVTSALSRRILCGSWADNPLMRISFKTKGVPFSKVTAAGQPFYTSATSSRQLGPNLGLFRDSVDGYRSPLGALGSGSAVEGIGITTTTGPSSVIARAAESAEWMNRDRSRDTDVFSNPRSPLSEAGALNKASYDAAMAPILAPMAFDFFFGGAEIVARTKQLEAGGSIGIAGRGGINNNAGWAGLLGPNGGYATRDLTVNANGDYVNSKGVIVTEIKNVAWTKDSSRTLRLVEKYTPERAAELSKQDKLDASWMVDAPLARAGDTQTFRFNVPAGEFLNVVVKPADQDSATLLRPSDFDLEILDRKGNVLANSIERNAIDWLQLYSEAPQKLQVRVRLVNPSATHAGRPSMYRLIIDTPTDAVKPDPKVAGAQQLPLGTIAVEQ